MAKEKKKKSKYKVTMVRKEVYEYLNSLEDDVPVDYDAMEHNSIYRFAYSPAQAKLLAEKARPDLAAAEAHLVR